MILDVRRRHRAPSSYYPSGLGRQFAKRRLRRERRLAERSMVYDGLTELNELREDAVVLQNAGDGGLQREPRLRFGLHELLAARKQG